MDCGDRSPPERLRVRGVRSTLFDGCAGSQNCNQSQKGYGKALEFRAKRQKHVFWVGNVISGLESTMRIGPNSDPRNHYSDPQF